MKKRLLFAPVLVLWSSALLVLSLFFGKIMLNPYHYLMENNEDGIKNYYTFAYYIKHDKGLQFTGLNYPYGDHIVYTDNHPIWAVFFNFIDDNIVSLADHSVALLNFWLFFSISLGTFFLYLILIKFGVGRWFAVPCALLIAFLSPQIDRTFAHFSLSYVYIIPMYWYWFMRFNEGKRQRVWGSLILISLVVFGLTQMYHVLIGAVFFLAYAFVYSVANARKLNQNKHLKYIGSLLLFAFLPILLIQMVMGFTDPYDDRIEIPYGFYTYKAFFEQTFFPVFPPLRQFFIYIFKARPTVFGEAATSVGLTGFVLLIVSLVRILRFIIKKQFHRVVKITLHRELNLTLWAAVLVLCFSFAFPFVWGMDWLLNYITPLRQFRSLARFAWVFYYVFLVYGSYYWYLNYRNLNGKGIKGITLSVVAVVMLIWGIEAHINLWYNSGGTSKWRGAMPRENTVFNEPPAYLDSLKAHGFEAENYQAALFFPYFHIGSEKFAIRRDYRTLRHAVTLSYHTGLPLFGNYCSRSSISRSLKTVQLLSSPLIEKEILTELNDKPILLGHHKLGGLEADEKRIVDKGRLIFETEVFAFYQLTKADFQSDIEKTIADFATKKDSLFVIKSNNQTFWTTDSSNFVFYESYENLVAPITFSGEGAATTTNGQLTIFDNSLPQDTIKRQVSFWLYTDTRENYPVLKYEKINDAGESTYKKEFSMRSQTEIDGKWIRVVIDLIPNPTERHRLMFSGAKHITVDDLLIQSINTPVYWEEKHGNLRLNGYQLIAN